MPSAPKLQSAPEGLPKNSYIRAKVITELPKLGVLSATFILSKNSRVLDAKISAKIGESRLISANVGESRLISAKIS